MNVKQFGRSVGLITTVFLVATSGSVFGATPVEQRSVGDDVYRRSTAAASPASPYTYAQSSNQGSSDPLWDMLNQVQMLQTEVLELRGMIDQQGYELQQLKMQQKQHYVDLDQRIEALNGSSARPSAGASQARPSGVPSDPEAVKAQYQSALRMVKERDYAGAESALATIVSSTDNNFYVPFANYWLAEVLLAKKNPNIKQAQKHFEFVISNHAGHSKVPPSMYKLGTIYHVNGDAKQARATLKQLISEFPGSSEAGMASHYLEQM